MRASIGWVVGIVVFGAVGLGFIFLGEAVGVPTALKLDEPTTITYGRGAEEEVTSLTTSMAIQAMPLRLS